MPAKVPGAKYIARAQAFAEAIDSPRARRLNYNAA